MYIDKMVQVVMSGIFSRLKMKYNLTRWWQHGITLAENKCKAWLHRLAAGTPPSNTHRSRENNLPHFLYMGKKKAVFVGVD